MKLSNYQPWACQDISAMHQSVYLWLNVLWLYGFDLSVVNSKLPLDVAGTAVREWWNFEIPSTRHCCFRFTVFWPLWCMFCTRSIRPSGVTSLQRQQPRGVSSTLRLQEAQWSRGHEYCCDSGWNKPFLWVSENCVRVWQRNGSVKSCETTKRRRRLQPRNKYRMCNMFE